MANFQKLTPVGFVLRPGYDNRRGTEVPVGNGKPSLADHLREGNAAALVQVTCKATGASLLWNDAAAAGWVADLDAPPFSTYYSPEGLASLTPTPST